MQMVDGFPRRNRIDLATPLERVIREARAAVESGPAHPLLTEASMLLEQALDKVADWVKQAERERDELKVLAGAALRSWDAWQADVETIIGRPLLGQWAALEALRAALGDGTGAATIPSPNASK